jgi:heme/copper-type cytochrome/quinol oxidase subunit 2
MNPAALIAAASQNHGPPHELVLGVVVVVGGVVGTVVYKAVTRRKSSRDHSNSNRNPES